LCDDELCYAAVQTHFSGARCTAAASKVVRKHRKIITFSEVPDISTEQLEQATLLIDGFGVSGDALQGKRQASPKRFCIIGEVHPRATA
jgi:hypothetical protein